MKRDPELREEKGATTEEEQRVEEKKVERVTEKKVEEVVKREIEGTVERKKEMIDEKVEEMKIGSTVAVAVERKRRETKGKKREVDGTTEATA